MQIFQTALLCISVFICCRFDFCILFLNLRHRVRVPLSPLSHPCFCVTREQASRNQREEKAQRRRQDKADNAALAKSYFEGKSGSSGVLIAPWAVSGAPMQPWTSCEQSTKVIIMAGALEHRHFCLSSLLIFYFLLF